MIRAKPWRSAGIAVWERSGRYRSMAGHSIFTLDTGPSLTERSEAVVVIHGFPTSSFDFRSVLPRLAEHRRVILLDLLGYGLSDKPDVAYTVGQQADLVAAVTDELGLDTFALLTHDMGDTVGGELLARQLDGAWPVTVTRGW